MLSKQVADSRLILSELKQLQDEKGIVKVKIEYLMNKFKLERCPCYSSIDLLLSKGDIIKIKKSTYKLKEVKIKKSNIIDIDRLDDDYYFNRERFDQVSGSNSYRVNQKKSKAID